MFRLKAPSSVPVQAKDRDLNSFKQSDVKTLSSHQVIEFLSLLLQEVTALQLPTLHINSLQSTSVHSPVPSFRIRSL